MRTILSEVGRKWQIICIYVHCIIQNGCVGRKVAILVEQNKQGVEIPSLLFYGCH